MCAARVGAALARKKSAGGIQDLSAEVVEATPHLEAGMGGTTARPLLEERAAMRCARGGGLPVEGEKSFVEDFRKESNRMIPR